MRRQRGVGGSRQLCWCRAASAFTLLTHQWPTVRLRPYYTTEDSVVCCCPTPSQWAYRGKKAVNLNIQSILGSVGEQDLSHRVSDFVDRWQIVGAWWNPLCRLVKNIEMFVRELRRSVDAVWAEVSSLHISASFLCVSLKCYCLLYSFRHRDGSEQLHCSQKTRNLVIFLPTIMGYYCNK